MALALELSRREGQPHQSPQKLHVQNRSPADSHSSATRRSFSSAPFYNYGVETSSEDDEDEALQMALACSLSEMEAQERAAVTNLISGAVGRAKATKDKANVQKESRVFKTNNVRVIVNGKVVSEENNEQTEVKIDSKSEGRWDKEGDTDTEPGLSADSPTTSNSTPLSNEQEADIKNNDGNVKKKKKCRCTLC